MLVFLITERKGQEQELKSDSRSIKIAAFFFLLKRLSLSLSLSPTGWLNNFAILQKFFFFPALESTSAAVFFVAVTVPGLYLQDHVIWQRAIKRESRARDMTIFNFLFLFFFQRIKNCGIVEAEGKLIWELGCFFCLCFVTFLFARGIQET